MKVLITKDLFFPSVNGVVTSVLSLMHGLQGCGHEVKILTLSDTIHTKTIEDIIYIGSSKAGLIYPGVRVCLNCPKQIIHDLVKWHPDVVHSQCEFNTFRIARKIARTCHAPLIHTYHTVYEDYTHYFSPSVRIGKVLTAWFTRKITRQTDAVIAPTEKVRRLLRDYRVPTPIAVIPTGLELQTKKISQTDIAELRSELGIPKDANVLLSIGRLAEEKNIPALFDILKDKQLQNTVLLLVGDGPFRGELEKRVEIAGLRNRVIFAGMVPHSEVSRYYQLGNVFVNASHSETQGLTFIEAMAAGIPVVCLSDPCVDGLIENGKTGFACETKRDMITAINKVLNDEETRRSISIAAEKLVLGAYSSDAFAASVEKLYQCTEAGTNHRQRLFFKKRKGRMPV